MKICNTCGEQLSDESAYCKRCGSKLQKRAEKPGSKLDDRKSRVVGRQRSGLVRAAIIGSAVIAAVAAGVLYSTYKPGAPPAVQQTATPAISGSPAPQRYTPVAPANGFVRILLKDIADGAAHYYVYTSGDKDIRFFVLRAPDGSVRASLDACTVCYQARAGYRQQGNSMICNKCGRAFSSTDIGIVTGGCNPIALDKTLDGQTVALRISAIEEGKKFF